MFAGMTSAQTVGWFSIVLLIGTPALILLVTWSAQRWPGQWREYAVREPHSHSSLGAPGHYREPADPSYVDELMRIRARFPVVHRADPVLVPDEPLRLDDIEHPPVSPAPVYSIPLADLVASVRYRVPGAAPAAHIPSHRAQAVDTAAAPHVGRHRALPAHALAGVAA